MGGGCVIWWCIDIRASYEDCKISKQDGHGDCDDSRIFRLFFDDADKHRLDEYLLYKGSEQKCAKCCDKNAEIPVTDSQKKDNQKILDIGTDHEKLAHGPVDDFHDSINEIDS